MAQEKKEYEEIYNAYSDKIMGLIRTKVANHADAEDLHSAVFLRIYEKYDSFDPAKASISTWIYTITNNMIIDYYRTRKVHEDIDDNFDLASEKDDFDGILKEEMLDELADALEQLDERSRDVVIMRYYHKMTLKEIAVKTGMSYGNCKIVHNKALLRLRNLMTI